MSTNDWPSSLKKHYGPGPHKSGSEQTVHQNGKGSSGGSAKKESDKGDRSNPDQITAEESFKLKDELLAKDGFTYQPVDDTSPTSGYSMAVFPEREKIIPIDEITVGDLYLFMRQNQDKFAEDDRIHFGAWYNEKTESNPNGDNQVYLDLSMVIEDQADAEEQAKELGQLGIYDLASGTTIETMTPDERKKWEEGNERSKTKSIDGREAGDAGSEGSDGNQDVRTTHGQEANGSGSGRSGEDGGDGHGQGWPESLKGILARGRQGLADERGGGDGSVATKEAEAFPELTEGHTTAFSEDSQSKSLDSDGDLVAAGLCVLANDTGRVLMLQRGIEDGDPASGKWEFPGGHIEEGEDPYTAAVREWEEETGHAVPDGLQTAHWDGSNGIYRGYVLEVDSEDEIKLNLDHEDRDVINPDDPDGDIVEVVAWWHPIDMLENQAMREELCVDMDLCHEAIEPVDGQVKSAAFLDGVLPEIIDGDGDGFIYDGTMNERPADPAAQEELRKQEEDLEAEAEEKKEKHPASATHLFEGEPVSASGEYTADGRPTSKVAEIAVFLQEQHGRHIDTIGGDISEEEKQYIVDALTEDAIFAMNGDDASAAVEWYENVGSDLWGSLEQKYPDLATEPEDKFRFMAGLALLSNGQDIDTNIRDASSLYEYWKKSGNWDTDHSFGTQTADFQSTAQLFESIQEKLGGWEATKELFDRQITPRQMADIGYKIFGKEGGSIADSPLSISGELGDETVPAFAIFGPKLGSFYNNLNGNTDTVTMDLWFARTMGRISGESVRMTDTKFNSRMRKADKHIPNLSEEELMGFDKQELLASVEETKQSGKISPDSALYKWSKARQKHYQESTSPKNPNGHGEKTELNLYANLYAKSVDELTLKGPANASQRKLYRELIDSTISQIKDQTGSELTPAGLQAALWFNEKKLYHRLGSPQPDGGSANTDNYGSAAKRLLDGKLKEIEIPWEPNQNQTSEKKSLASYTQQKTGSTSQKKTSSTTTKRNGLRQSPSTQTLTSLQTTSLRSSKRMEAMAMRKAIQGLKIRVQGLRKSVRADGIPVDGDGDGYVFDGTPEERPYTPAEADALLAELTSEADQDLEEAKRQEELAQYHEMVGDEKQYGQNQFVSRGDSPDLSEIIMPDGSYAGTGLSGSDPYDEYFAQFSPEALAYKLRAIESVELTPERLQEMEEKGQRGYGFGVQHKRIKDALHDKGVQSSEDIDKAASKLASVAPKLNIEALVDNDALSEVKMLRAARKKASEEYQKAKLNLENARRDRTMQPDNEAANRQFEIAADAFDSIDDIDSNAMKIARHADRKYLSETKAKLLDSVNSLEPMEGETKFETLSRLENDITNHRDLITAMQGMVQDDADRLGLDSYDVMQVRHAIEDSLEIAEEEYSQTAGLDKSEQQFFGFDSGVRSQQEREKALHQYYSEEHDSLRSDIDSRHDRIDAIDNTKANDLDVDSYQALRAEKQELIGSIENDLKRLKYLDGKRDATSPSKVSNRYRKWRDPESLRAVKWMTDDDGDKEAYFNAAGKEFKTTIVGGGSDLPSSVIEHLEDRGIIAYDHDDSYLNIASMMFSDEEGRYSQTGEVGGGGARQVMKGAAITLGSHIARENPSIITFTASGQSRKDLYKFLTSRAHEIYDGYTGYGASKSGLFAIVSDDVKEDFEESVDLGGYESAYKNLSQEQIDKRSRKSFIEISATEKMMDQVVHELINDGTPYEEPVEAEKPSKKAVGMNTFMPERGGTMVLPEYHCKDGVIDLLKDIESKKQDITRSLYNIEHAGVKSYGEKMLQKLHDGSEAIKKAMAADMSLPEIIDGDSDGFIYDGSTNERPADPAAQEELRRRVDQLETKVKQAEQKIEQAAERVELAEGERNLRGVELEGSERFVPEGGVVKQLNDLELIDAYQKSQLNEDKRVMIGGENVPEWEVVEELSKRFRGRMESFEVAYTSQPVVGANHFSKVLENPSDFIDADGNLTPYNQKVATDSYDIDAMHEGAVDEYNKLARQAFDTKVEIEKLRGEEQSLSWNTDQPDHAEKLAAVHEKRDELIKQKTSTIMEQSFIMDDVRNRVGEEIAKVEGEILRGVGDGMEEAEAQRRLADRLRSMMVRGEENNGPANSIEEKVNTTLMEAARDADNRAAALINKHGGADDEQQFFGFDTGKRGPEEGAAGLVMHLRDKQSELAEAIKGVDEGSTEHKELMSNLERVKAGLRVNADYQNMPLSKEDEAIIKDIFADNPSAAFVNVDAGDIAENYDQMPYHKQLTAKNKYTEKLLADKENKEMYLEDARVDLAINAPTLYPEAMREATAAAGISAVEANRIIDEIDKMSYSEAKSFIKENDFAQKLMEVKSDDLDADYKYWCDSFVEEVMMNDEGSKKKLYDFAIESGILNIIDDTEGYVEERFGFDGQTIASLVGAPDDAEVVATVRYQEGNKETGSEGHGMIHVEVMHDDIDEMNRTIKIRDGQLSISHDNFGKNDSAPAGFSTKILARAIPALQKAGFTGIRTSAAGAGSEEVGGGARGSYTGYYNWARSGFNGELTSAMKTRIGEVAPDLDVDSMRTVLDVMKTKEGRKAWRDFGSGFSAHFDMMEGARSLDVIQRYALEKYHRQDWRPFERNE